MTAEKELRETASAVLLIERREGTTTIYPLPDLGTCLQSCMGLLHHYCISLHSCGEDVGRDDTHNLR